MTSPGQVGYMSSCPQEKEACCTFLPVQSSSQHTEQFASLERHAFWYNEDLSKAPRLALSPALRGLAFLVVAKQASGWLPGWKGRIHI